MSTKLLIGECVTIVTDPLFVYTKNGEVFKVHRLLINGADPNIKHPLGWSAIHIAAIQERPEIVKLLIEVSITIISHTIFNISNVSNTNLQVWCRSKFRG